MCTGTKTDYSCGHVETHFTSVCGRKCSSPAGPTTYLDAPCPRCDPSNTKAKRKARAAELMSQLMGPQHEEDAADVQNMTARAAEIQLSMHQNIKNARDFMYGGSDQKPVAVGQSWGAVGPDSDSDSDDGRSDTSYLTDDGRHVIQKQYKLINGHWALIAYRRELHEVDPVLLVKLREKRDKALAKRETKERKKEEKRRARNGDNNSSQESGNMKAKEVEMEQKSPLNPNSTPTLAHSTGTTDQIEKWRASEPASRPATTYSRPRRLITEEQAEQQREEEEKLARIRETIHLYPYEKTTPPPSPPRVDEHELHRRVSLSRQASEGIPESSKAILRKGRNRTPSLSSPASSFRTVRWPSYSSQEYDQEPILPEREEHEQDTEPVQAESSAAPARRALRRTKRGTWVERFAEDITYDSADDADSDVTVHKVPVRQPSRRGRTTSYGRSQSHRIEEIPEDLDIWEQIYDANDKGKRPMRRH
ncbi:hypothetical protein HD806DRAFT_163969 [Xylariaceae sp. AK1471]|nr:hypothetical protein HD806DRAFT_163969 [Xylariaceae sp. AK1471]